jgi:hypothetical protein
MEASGHARWFERLLAELQLELWIGDAAEIRTKRVRIVQGAIPEKLAGREACHDVSVLDQTGRIRVGSINFYSPSHARRNYELVTGSRHRAIQPRSKTMDVRDG